MKKSGKGKAGKEIDELIGEGSATPGECMERLAKVGEMAAGVVHEARNRMTGALSFAQVGKRDARDPDKAMENFGRIENEIRRCMELFEGLLAATRGSTPAFLEIALRTLSVSELVTAAEGLTSAILEEKGGEIEIVLEDSLPMVMVDGNVVVESLLNLIVNATQAGGRGMRIGVSASRKGDFLELAVFDDGPGVPPDLRGIVFDPFVTSKETGVGLGLSTSRERLRAFGADLVLSESKIGARFVVSLPVAPDVAPEQGNVE